MSDILTNKISAVRRKQAYLAAVRGLAAMAGLAVLLLAAAMLVDWLIELPRLVRTAILAVNVALLTYQFLWRVLAPIVFPPDDDDIALMVERAIPDFRTRLIASVQLSRPGAVPAGGSQTLVQAMVAQTESMAEPLDFTHIVRPDAAVKSSAIATLIVAAGLALFAWGGQVSSDLLWRALLSDRPVPRNTRVRCLTENRRVALGDRVVLEAEAQGIIPAAGKVELRTASGRQQEFSLAPVESGASRFARAIENVQESFRYRIALNDGRSPWFRIEALPRPAMLGVEFRQHYPSYIRRPPERRAPGDLSLLAGSKLQVMVRSSKPLSGAAAHLAGLDREHLLTVEADKASAGTPNPADMIDVPLKGLSGVSFRLVDEYGIASGGETVYPIDVLPDKDPAVKITYPDRKEELATQQAKVLIGFEATDDFGVAAITLWYKRDADAAPTPIKLDLSDQGDLRRIQRRYELNLGSLQPLAPEGAIVECWLEAQDANDKTGPGKATSDHYRIKIVSEIEKRADLVNRLSDQLGAIDHVTQDQEALNQNLGRLILEKR